MASIMEDVNNIKLLQALLQPHNDSSDSEDDLLPSCGYHKFGPADVVAGTKKTPSSNQTSQGELCKVDKKISTSRSIEEYEEFEQAEALDALESRKRPEHSISYKQSVTPQDVYLQMGNKSSATSSCDEMIVKIQLPDETVGIESMNLSVASNQIDLQTPVYRLRLPLVQPINPDKGKAQYDIDQNCLILSLKMEREFDFVNF